MCCLYVVPSGASVSRSDGLLFLMCCLYVVPSGASVSRSDGSLFLLCCYDCALHGVLCLQEGELDVEEGRDLLQESPCVATSVTPADTGLSKDQAPPSKGHRLPTLKLANPFSKRKVSRHSGCISTIILRK
jgi:hypothetical protein